MIYLLYYHPVIPPYDIYLGRLYGNGSLGFMHVTSRFSFPLIPPVSFVNSPTLSLSPYLSLSLVISFSLSLSRLQSQ